MALKYSITVLQTSLLYCCKVNSDKNINTTSTVLTQIYPFEWIEHIKNSRIGELQSIPWD
jgi:hypothetical protein